MTSPPEPPINDEALNEAHILHEQVCDHEQVCIIKSAKSSMLKLDSLEIWLRKSIKRP